MKTKIITNNKKAFIIVFAVSLTLFSCGNNAKKEISFPKEKNIILEDMNLKEQLGSVFFIKSLDNYLAVTGKNIDETQVQLIDKQTKAGYTFGQAGNGPGRFLQAYSIIPVDYERFAVFDVQKRMLFDCNTDSVVRSGSDYFPEILIKEIPTFPTSFDRLSDSVYVALGLTNGLKRFTLLNKNGEIISSEGSLPEKKDEQTSDFVHAFAYYGKLTANPEECKIAVCTNYAGIIQFYDCKTKDVRLIKEHNSFLADYTESDGSFIPTAETRWGYLSIDSNSKYVFALYSGLNQSENSDGSFSRSNTVHVYDWEGNPVCKLSSDRKLTMICVDDTHLYGYGDEDGTLMVAGIEDI